jgi:tetratricopeptide (TPR) repeat protein
VQRVDVTGSQGVQLGDGNVQINLFSGVQPPGPVVAGNIPQPAPAFQPRGDLMAALRSAGPGVSVVRAVTGLRGVGKTQLAAAYARDRRKVGWRLIAWVNAETTPAILDGLAVVADRLGIDRADKPLDVLGLEVRNRLEADGDRCLIVFDNVTDPDAIAPYVPSIGDPQVLITSTESSVQALGKPVQVAVFTEEEALAFLAARTGLGDESGPRTLARELGYLPLALSQAAAVIRTQHLTYPVYLDRLRSYPAAKFLPPAKGEPYPRGAAEAIGLSIDTVTAADPTDPANHGSLCRELLDIVALLSPDGVSRELLYSGEPAGVLAVGVEELDEALGRLASASLLTFTGTPPVTVNASTVIAHRLVMRVARERAVHDGTLAGVAVQAIALLRAYGQSLGGSRLNPRAARDLIRQVEALTEVVASQPRGKVDEELLNLRLETLHHLLDLRDNLPRAVEITEKLAADIERTYGRSHPTTVTFLTILARFYLVMDRLSEAVPMLEGVLPEQERMLGMSHPGTLQIRQDLGGAYLGVGRTAEAVSLFEQVATDRERQLGVTHPDTLAIQRDLAAAYQAVGRVDAAASLSERTVSGYEGLAGESEQRLGGSHPDTLLIRHQLGLAYLTVGREGDAVELLERVAAACDQVPGMSYPDTLQIRYDLAGAYYTTGRLGDAVPLFERVAAERERVPGESNIVLVTSWGHLATAYMAVGRMNEAVALYERAVATLERTLGAENPNTVAQRETLARAREIAARAGRSSS